MGVCHSVEDAKTDKFLRNKQIRPLTWVVKIKKSWQETVNPTITIQTMRTSSVKGKFAYEDFPQLQKLKRSSLKMKNYEELNRTNRKSKKNKTRNPSSLKAREWIFLNRLNLFESFESNWMNVFESIFELIESLLKSLLKSIWSQMTSVMNEMIWIEWMYLNWYLNLLNSFESIESIWSKMTSGNDDEKRYVEAR